MTEHATPPKPRILVVDDTQSIHDDFRKILLDSSDTGALNDLRSAIFGVDARPKTKADYELDSALQGEQALEMLNKAMEESRPYSVAFVDMRMPPGWDGLQTIEQLWSKDGNLQVVICSAFSDYSVDEIRDRLGLVDKLLILKKPFESVEISQLACALTEKWGLAQTAGIKLKEMETLVEE